MPLIRWDPFRDLEELFDKNHSRLGWDFAIDVYEEDNNIIVKMNVPGIEPNKFDITIENDTLRVSGSREQEEETEDKDYYRKEIRRGSFERVIPLPTAVQSSKTSAGYENGVLTISMPKKSPVESKQIKVKVQ